MRVLAVAGALAGEAPSAAAVALMFARMRSPCASLPYCCLNAVRLSTPSLGRWRRRMNGVYTTSTAAADARCGGDRTEQTLEANVAVRAHDVGDHLNSHRLVGRHCVLRVLLSLECL